jgi:hypothetical protein
VTALHDDFFGIAFGGGGVSTVRQRAKHCVPDGVGDGSGRLRAAGPVKVGGAVAERGKVLSDRVDVERQSLGGIVARARHE